MIYFSLNYVVLCTRPSRPRPQLYDMDGRYHSGSVQLLAACMYEQVRVWCSVHTQLGCVNYVCGVNFSKFPLAVY
jgi:hypothetical protein